MKNQNIQQTINTIIKRHINIQPDLLFLKSLLIEQQQKVYHKITKYKNKYKQAINVLTNQQTTTKNNSPALQIRNAKSNQKYLDNHQSKFIPSNIFMNQFLQQTHTLKGILHKFIHQTNEPILRNKLLSLHKIFASSLDQIQKIYQKQLNRYSTEDIHKNSTKIKEHLLQQLKRQIQKNKLLQQKLRNNQISNQKLKSSLDNTQQALIQRDIQIKKLRQTLQDLNKKINSRGILKQNNSNVINMSNKLKGNDHNQANSKINIPTIFNNQQVSNSFTNNIPQILNQFSQFVDTTKTNRQLQFNDQKQQILPIDSQNLENENSQNRIQSKLGCFYNANQTMKIGKLVKDLQQPKNAKFQEYKQTQIKIQNKKSPDMFLQSIEAKNITNDLLKENNILKKQIKRLQNEQKMNIQKLQKANKNNNQLFNENNELKNKIKMHSDEYAQLQKEVNHLYNQFQHKQENQTQDLHDFNNSKQQHKFHQKNILTQKIQSKNIQNNIPACKMQVQKQKLQTKDEQSRYEGKYFYTPIKTKKLQIINDLISVTENSKRPYFKQSKTYNLTLNQTQEDKIIAQAELALSRIDNTEIYTQKPGDFSDLSIIHQKQQHNKTQKIRMQAPRNQSYFSDKQKPIIKPQTKIKQNSQKVQRVRFRDDYQKEDELLRMILVQAITIESNIENQDFKNQFIRYN